MLRPEVARMRGRGLLMTPPILLWSSRSIRGCAGPCPGCCVVRALCLCVFGGAVFTLTDRGLLGRGMAVCGYVTVCWGGRWRAGGQCPSCWGGDLQQSLRSFYLHGQPGSTRGWREWQAGVESDRGSGSLGRLWGHQSQLLWAVVIWRMMVLM